MRGPSMKSLIAELTASHSLARCHNVVAMKPRAPNMKSGLPGTPEEQKSELRAAMKKHKETLRRLAQ